MKRMDDQEAVVEAVLFTMGKSVEVRQLAAALETDQETAKKAVLDFRNGIRKKRGECRLLSWKTPTRCAPEQSITPISFG